MVNFRSCIKIISLEEPYYFGAEFTDVGVRHMVDPKRPSTLHLWDLKVDRVKRNKSCSRLNCLHYLKFHIYQEPEPEPGSISWKT